MKDGAQELESIKSDLLVKNSVLEEEASMRNNVPNTMSEFLQSKHPRKYQRVVSNNNTWFLQHGQNT